MLSMQDKVNAGKASRIAQIYSTLTIINNTCYFNPQFKRASIVNFYAYLSLLTFVFIIVDSYSSFSAFNYSSIITRISMVFHNFLEQLCKYSTRIFGCHNDVTRGEQSALRGVSPIIGISSPGVDKQWVKSYRFYSLPDEYL